jgi:predicted N-acyltransferase
VGLARDRDAAGLVRRLVAAVTARAAETGCSGWHVLFPESGLGERVAVPGDEAFLHRHDVQFHWFNRGYRAFDDYLAALRSSRRKNIRRERRAVAERGVVLARKTGGDIEAEEWSAFFSCYTDTFRKRSGHDGYLTRAFFDRLLEKMGDQLMLVVARLEGEVIASSLFLFDSRRLYGRYWGALADIRYMHFEACFYQGIEFCIERGIREFDPGTQGEHKLLRGFEPVETRSLHWIADRRFRAAISDFLERERRNVSAYGRQAARYLPFRQSGVASK